MEFSETEIGGVWMIRPRRFGDARGYFSETFKEAEFAAHIGAVHFVQDNESVSRRGVLRGLHYQRGAASQAKLVRVSRGTVVDVAVDLRRPSPTFGKYIAARLSAEEGTQLFVPRGFAHGFYVVSDEAQFQYKVDNVYCPEAEVSILWNDPALAVAWPIEPGTEPLLSAKDLQGIPFGDAPLFD